jgi:ABC-2 type transport system ATP-binding protein
MESREPIIIACGLSRVYKETRAVDSLDLEIPPGELFGLVGPDGAGKTTTLRLLAGILNISAGEASISGFDLVDQAENVKSRIGYMAQQFSLYAELTVVENLAFFADIYDVDTVSLTERMDRLLNFAGLMDFRTRRADKLSGGMQKKLALACSMIHQPEILLLDEPTTGVDPISRREFWNILTELHLQGTTIIVSTPYMDEADRCSRVGLMYEGKMIVCNKPSEIRKSIDGDLIIIRPDQWREAYKLLITLPGVHEVQTYGEALHMIVDRASTRLPEIKKALNKSGIKFKDARKAPARMEEVFISLIKKMED